MSAENPGRVETLVRIGVTLCGVQIEATQISARDLLKDSFVIGYCFGLFETMAQMAGLDQYSEGVVFMERAFGQLVNAPDAGAALFRSALEARGDADFSAGAEAGEKDLEAWYANADAMPTGLALRAARKA